MRLPTCSTMPNIRIAMRVAKRVTVCPETGCWLVSGWNDGRGYAKMRIKNIPEYVHRVMYRIYKNESLRGREVDHICKQRNCCNPDHLQSVTRKKNMQLMHKRLDRSEENRI